MENNPPIEIQHSRTKLAALATLAFLFVSAGLWFLLKPQDVVSAAYPDEALLRVVGISTVVLAGACGIFILKKLGDKEPGVIISDEGITDRSNAGSIGSVPWADVLAIEETTVLNQKFVSIALKNPEHYINLQPGKFKRKLINANYKRFGYVINITANSLQCHHHQLKVLLDDAFNNYRARTGQAR